MDEVFDQEQRNEAHFGKLPELLQQYEGTANQQQIEPNNADRERNQENHRLSPQHEAVLEQIGRSKGSVDGRREVRESRAESENHQIATEGQGAGRRHEPAARCL